ncbi:permease [Dickeya fangzhongdai]|uniref:sulfite exporter TauE/SafE family protein n=1 Tax=Dickeya fangzhongdai TaxID=1778540 RepID=UPI0005751B22|nr:sulfite exporter TauE/SafE family protein [Dickeya fangzhongdai]KHN52904.1 permease [Dickeya fangzhongdai]
MKVNKSRSFKGFVAGSLIGTLGGLIGLGGAEFRLPVLVDIFRLDTLKAVILNKAMSLVVVAVALLFRLKTIPVDQILFHWDVVVNLLAGSLVGAWWAAGHAIRMSKTLLNQIIMVVLIALSFLMLSEAFFHLHDNGGPLISTLYVRVLVGIIAGFGIGVVAALLGVAGGELLIPTIVLLFGLDVKLAGSLSLAVSLPTMIVGFFRYAKSDSFSVLKEEMTLFKWMSIGSVIGAAIGGLLLGSVPVQILTSVLGVILLISAIKTFKHTRHH